MGFDSVLFGKCVYVLRLKPGMEKLQSIKIRDIQSEPLSTSSWCHCFRFQYGYGAEHILSMNVVLADGSIGSVDKVRDINQSGGIIHYYWPITGQNYDILPQSTGHHPHSH